MQALDLLVETHKLQAKFSRMFAQSELTRASAFRKGNFADVFIHALSVRIKKYIEKVLDSIVDVISKVSLPTFTPEVCPPGVEISHRAPVFFCSVRAPVF